MPNDVRVCLVADTGGDPDETNVLASTYISKDSLTASYAWYTADFTDYEGTSGTRYHIMINTSGGDFANCVHVGFQYPGSYSPGGMFFSTTSGGSWTNYTATPYDITFKTYGYNVSADLPPDITINFVGNTSDDGGAYYSYKEDSVATDGYYANMSKQSENFMLINATVTNATSVNVNYSVGGVWDNTSNSMTNTNGNYYEYNLSVTSASALVTFDIYAINSTRGNSSTYWLKPNRRDGDTKLWDYTRRYVTLNCTPIQEPLNYTKTYYFYMGEYDVDKTTNNDGMLHDQSWLTSTTDTGILNTTIPSDTLVNVSCTSTTISWFDEEVSLNSTTLENCHFHIWYDTSDTPDDNKAGFAVKKSNAGGTGISYANDDHVNITNSDIILNKTFYGRDMHLVDGNITISKLADYNISDNDIYEIYFTAIVYLGTEVFIGNNRSYLSCVRFNVPSSATYLQSVDTDNDGLSDYDELYTTHTLLDVSDTDGDGVSDYYETLSGSDPNNYTDTAMWNVPIQSTHKVLDNGANHTLNATDVLVSPMSFWVTINDPNGDKMNITIMENSSGWKTVNQTTGNGLSNGTYSFTNVSWITDYDTKYYITFNVTDGTNWNNVTKHFTTVANTAPTVDYKTPINGTTDVAISGGVTCYAYTNDTDGDPLDITWATNESGSWLNKHTNTSEVANGTESYTFTDFDTASTTYWWKVYVDDGTTNISETYHFTTEASGNPDCWVDAAWNYCKAITIDHTKVDATLTNFPILVQITSDSDLATNAQPDGDDILFTIDNTTKFNHEIESWVDDGNYVNASIWVNITSLSGTADIGWNYVESFEED